MKRVLIIIVLLMLPQVFALCEDGQIDINSASLEELDDLIGIGPVKAEAIINSRDFESVDSLIKVYGIKEATLNKIKGQGLACVDENVEEVIVEELIEDSEEIIKERHLPKPVEYVKPKTIKLVSQNIKRENDTQDLDKSDYAIYGFVAFCILLSFLFILKKFKRHKTEFE